MNRGLAFSAACAAAFLAAVVFSPAAEVRADDEPEYVPGQVIVKFKDSSTPEGVRRALGRVRGRRGQEIAARRSGREDLPGTVVVELEESVESAVRSLRADPNVEYAEPDWLVWHEAVSNDSYFVTKKLWNMYGDATTPANKFGSQAGEAWARGNVGSKGVYVGILDTGIDISHPDLAANIWKNAAEVVDGKDNDGNGYIDDVNGYDFLNNDASVFDGKPKSNYEQHGTHVAGTIGGIGGNKVGVAGVNWSVQMISCKFIGYTGAGASSNAARAMYYLIDLKKRHGLNIVATNNSWGGGAYSQAMVDAVLAGRDAGILFVAAAGNSTKNNDTVLTYPANYTTSTSTNVTESVISVAATDLKGVLASFSNYGAATVDLAAPGVGIWSTSPYNTYASLNGTSMACPHVTGAAALYAASHPSATITEIRSAILNSAIPTPGLSGKVATGGRLDCGGF